MQHYPAPFDENKTKDWIAWNLENYQKYGFGLWAVVLKESGEFIGEYTKLWNLIPHLLSMNFPYPFKQIL